jgi:hypothetical protein
VSPVKYEQGFYIPEDDILHSAYPYKYHFAEAVQENNHSLF